MTSPNTIITRGAQTSNEFNQANDLMAKIHCRDYFTAIDWIRTCGAGYPNTLREHTRIAWIANEMAGALRITSDTIRLGEARLRMGGFGWVSTDPAFRRKGVAAALMHDALAYMKHNGYHVSMLFGIPNFYHRFGFVTTLAEYAIIALTAEALTASPGPYRLRKAKPSDIHAIQKIHAANDAETACSLIRTAAHITNKWDQWREGLHVLTNEQGRVAGYLHAVNQPNELLVTGLGIIENTNNNEAACNAILAACAEIAGHEAAGRIRFQVPPPHPFARFLLNFNSTHEAQIVHDCGGMMAFINIEETLESMIPEWEALLARHALRDLNTELTLLIDRIPYRIRTRRGAIDITAATGPNKFSITAPELMHLLTGYRYTADILATCRRNLTEQARWLIAALFPKRTPYVWHFDRF